jgi:hypothetical protein
MTWKLFELFVQFVVLLSRIYLNPCDQVITLTQLLKSPVLLAYYYEDYYSEITCVLLI